LLLTIGSEKEKPKKAVGEKTNLQNLLGLKIEEN
jgi:hypothetical protein